MTTPQHKWRINDTLSEIHKDTGTYYDLFTNGVYQHTWIFHDRLANTYTLYDRDGSYGGFPSFSEAEDFLLTLLVVARFERAYKHLS